LGESFRPFLKRYQVHLTYAAAISYVCCDAGDKSFKEYKVNYDSNNVISNIIK